MNLGQTMLSVASLTLLTVVLLNVNRVIIETEVGKYEAEAFDLAVEFAQDLLAEAATKRYDANASTSSYQDTDDFTSSSSLGPSWVEGILPWPDVAPFKSHATYDDFDDYNGYRRIVNTSRYSGFLVSVRVYYVSSTNPNTTSSSRTYTKRMDVTVEHPQYLKPITLSSIMTY